MADAGLVAEVVQSVLHAIRPSSRRRALRRRGRRTLRAGLGSYALAAPCAGLGVGVLACVAAAPAHQRLALAGVGAALTAAALALALCLRNAEVEFDLRQVWFRRALRRHRVPWAEARLLRRRPGHDDWVLETRSDGHVIVSSLLVGRRDFLRMARRAGVRLEGFERHEWG